MRQVLRSFYFGILVLLMYPLTVLGQAPQNTVFKSGKAESEAGAIFSSLMSAWWMWAGIIAILGLLGALYYLRNKTDD